MNTLISGTCAAAGYTGGCCTSGTCRGSPPTCYCDSTCHFFQDCCSDVPPSCQPGEQVHICVYTFQHTFKFLLAVDVLEFTSVPTNIMVVLGMQSQLTSQFQCSVRASHITNFNWTFTSTSYSSSSQSTLQQIATSEEGSLNTKYSVISTDYSSVLTIQDVQFSDTGNYTCIASIGDRVSPIATTFIHTVQGSYKDLIAYTHMLIHYFMYSLCSASK